MTRISKITLLALATAAFISAAGNAHADIDAPFQDKLAPQSSASAVYVLKAEEQIYTQFAQNKVSASEAKSIARRHVGGGEAVDISRSGDTYRVRVIAKDGRVVDVLIDANTGRVKR